MADLANEERLKARADALGGQVQEPGSGTANPRQVLMQEISRRSEACVHQLIFLQQLKVDVEFMGRHEADLLLRAIRNAECSGLLRW